MNKVIRQKELREIRRENKLCYICGNSVYNNTTMCEKHLIEKREKNRITRKNQKEKGLCKDCSQPALEGKTVCEKHNYKYPDIVYQSQRGSVATKQQQKQQQKRMELGLCKYCLNPVTEGYKMCEKHLEYYRSKTKSKIFELNEIAQIKKSLSLQKKDIPFVTVKENELEVTIYKTGDKYRIVPKEEIKSNKQIKEIVNILYQKLYE